MFQNMKCGAPAVVQQDRCCFCSGSGCCKGMGVMLGQAQWVRDLALPQLWCRSQLRHKFGSWSGELPHASGLARNKHKKLLKTAVYMVGNKTSIYLIWFNIFLT